MMRFTILSLATQVFVAVAPLRGALAQHTPTSGRTAVVDSCLPPSEFQLRGVQLTSLSSVAVEALGQPLRVTADSGEDDGGRYEVKTFHYRDVDFDEVRGFVDRLATHSPRVATPSGLRPGLSFEAVGEILRHQGVRLRQPADTIDITSCEPPDASILLALDPTHHVRTLLMGAARP